MLPHLICHASAAPVVTTDVDVQVVSALIPSCPDMDVMANGKDDLLAIMVTTSWVCVKC